MESIGQDTLRSVDQLINRSQSGWINVAGWIAAASNKVEVLPCDTVNSRDALYKTQVTTRSPMGAIIYSTGGLLVDNGWIRILGSGHPRLNRTLPDWNIGKSMNEFGKMPPFLLIADDAAGGFFAINGGQFGHDAGKVYYMSPDNLIWEPLSMTYTEFLLFCFNGDLKKFYSTLRWKNWQKDMLTLDGSQTFNFIPYLWSKEGRDINKNSRKAVPVEEQYNFNMITRQQLGIP